MIIMCLLGPRLPNFFFSKMGERKQHSTRLGDIPWEDCRLLQHRLGKQEQIFIINEQRASFDGITNFGRYRRNCWGLLFCVPFSFE